MKNQGKIILLLSFALVAFAYLIWQVYRTNNRLRLTRGQIDRASLIIQNIQDLYASVLASESAARAYAITKHTIFESELTELAGLIEDRIDNTRRVIRDSVTGRDFNELERLIREKLAFQLNLVAIPQQSIP